MSNARDHRRSSRYSVGGSENEYMDRKKTVLKNKRGILDLHELYIEEEKALAGAYEQLLDEVRSDTPIMSELIRHAHGRIFADLYDWAGRWRTVTISKPGVTWPPPDYLQEAMEHFEREVLLRYPASSLDTDKSFCDAIGHIQGEFLAIHPFREGNARTIKLVTDLLAVQTGRLGLMYDASEKGRDQYISAAKSAMNKDYKPMTKIIKTALNAAKRSS
jgi:cell filamentation protein